ncbi:hypothetical protein [Rhodococcoides fascians]|uniref:hypothetical protein n=1 Tax=Rhodococcoides fascians TaxID=1828 RepID=UPI000567A12B|nr:hypothetical protein [Rhodococcus fascians]
MTRYLVDDQLTQVLHDRRNVRLSRSSNGRPQLILETKGSPTTAGLSIAKPSITLDRQQTITRVRSVRADIYRSEVALRDVDVPEVEQPRLPEWRYVTDDGDSGASGAPKVIQSNWVTSSHLFRRKRWCVV